MQSKPLSLAVALAFFVVGVIASVNTYRLNSYINETVKRDAAQEQCAKETLDSLKRRNEAISLYLKNEDDTQAIKDALVDRINQIGFPDCDFGGHR